MYTPEPLKSVMAWRLFWLNTFFVYIMQDSIVKCISTISLFRKYSVFTFLLECPSSRSEIWDPGHPAPFLKTYCPFQMLTCFKDVSFPSISIRICECSGYKAYVWYNHECLLWSVEDLFWWREEFYSHYVRVSVTNGVCTFN